MFFFPGDLALVAFVVTALFLIAFARSMKRRLKRTVSVWPLGVAVASWFGYGVWELYLVGSDYLRYDIIYLWPLLLLVSVFAVVWARTENASKRNHWRSVNWSNENISQQENPFAAGLYRKEHRQEGGE